MTFEHFALNVSDARAHSRWYVEHAGFRILRQGANEPYTHFLSDSTGRAIIELYSNPTAAVHDFRAHAPLTFHFALIAADARKESVRFVAAGATFLTEQDLPDGDRLIMLRDPWGVCLQLCQRAKPLQAAQA